MWDGHISDLDYLLLRNVFLTEQEAQKTNYTMHNLSPTALQFFEELGISPPPQTRIVNQEDQKNDYLVRKKFEVIEDTEVVIVNQAERIVEQAEKKEIRKKIRQENYKTKIDVSTRSEYHRLNSENIHKLGKFGTVEAFNNLLQWTDGDMNPKLLRIIRKERRKMLKLPKV